jgi:dihydropteroate synthase
MKLGVLNLPTSPVVMGILNLTPDSFYDGGSYTIVDQAITRAEQILHEGAAIIDVGGESTRPGAAKVSVQEELDRVIPIISSISARFALPISIDTSNPEVMQEAVKAGAKMINDVRALTKPGAITMVAKLGVPVCIMHMQNDPVTMQLAPTYKDVVSEVYQYLEQRLAACVAGGVDSNKIIVDPGFGFGKNLQHNLKLLRSLEIFKGLQHPLLVGMSHKSMIGQILDVGVEHRIYGSVAAAVIAASKGADIVRVHDVQATVDAIKVFNAAAS